jgi:hypothetical protein
MMNTGVAVAVGVKVSVTVGVNVTVGEGVNVAVTVGVTVGVGVCVAKRDATASGAEQPVRRKKITKAGSIRFIDSFQIRAKTIM